VAIFKLLTQHLPRWYED